MRRIVLHLAGMPCDQKASLAAAALARRLDAHIEGLYIRLDASEILPRLGEGLSGAAIDSILQSTSQLASEGAARARATLLAAADGAGIERVTLADAAAPSVYFQDAEGQALEVLDSEARLADLLIFGEPGDDAPIDWIGRIEHALIETRRPILVTRGAVAVDFGDRVLVAYDGSLEAANALVSAAPILAVAQIVEVLQIRENDQSPDHATAAVRYLKQQGADASAHVMKQANAQAGDAIAARAAETGASLIVMGGYGRSRLRELILGGTTRHLIHHAPVPVLLAH